VVALPRVGRARRTAVTRQAGSGDCGRRRARVRRQGERGGGGAACGHGRGGQERRGRGWQRALPMAMAVRASSRAATEPASAQRKCAREGEGDGGRQGDTRALGLGAAGHEAARGTEVGRAAAMKRALCCMAAMAPFRRTRGERHCACLGVRFWASSAPNWAMGLEAKFVIF
jgi:hypothetical protein